MRFPLTFDDAAIFPPGDMPLPQAIAAHRVHRASAYADLVGPLVVGLSELPWLAGEGPLDVAVVVTGAEGAAEAVATAGALADIHLVALEVKDATVASLREAIKEPEGVAVYVEVPRDGRGAEIIAHLADSGYHAKVRTGGVQAQMYPSEHELAAAVVALTSVGVRFKATAGLHHALRNTDPETGYEQHGFVNLLAATGRAQAGAPVEEVAAVLAERDPARLPALPQRAALRSIGTCVITEPVEELAALGWVSL